MRLSTALIWRRWHGKPPERGKVGTLKPLLWAWVENLDTPLDCSHIFELAPKVHLLMHALVV